MIVDDVIFNIDILKDVLSMVLNINVDEDVVEALNGKQALIKYRDLMKRNEGRNQIKLILMDCDMPLMNGF